jgi:DNA repair exonuclease SbcCD ATPase subunit
MPMCRSLEVDHPELVRVHYIGSKYASDRLIGKPPLFQGFYRFKSCSLAQMNLIKLKQLTISNFGPFVGDHVIDFTTSGLTLVKGRVQETSDGSGAGKSMVLNGLAYLFGGCPYPGTQLQSWFSEETPSSSVVIETGCGEITIKRHDGLVITGGQYKDKLKGKAAEAELDNIFGMDEKSRGVVTYRGQRKPGLFLSMPDAEKKSFLAKLLNLEVYERLERAAKEKAESLQGDVGTADFEYIVVNGSLKEAKEKLSEAETNCPEIPDSSLINEYKQKINNKQNKLASLRTELEAVKTKSRAELDAVVDSINKKSRAVYNQPDPIELTAIKNAKTELQKLLDLLKQKDNEAKLEVEKQRSKAKSALQGQLDLLKQRDNEVKLEVEKQRSKIKSDGQDLNNIVKTESQLKADLEQVEKQELILLDKKCFTCKRDWVTDDANKQLSDLFIKKTVLLDRLGGIEVAKQALQGCRIKLQALKDPEPNPEILVISNKIRDVDGSIKDPVPNPEISITANKIKDLDNESVAVKTKTQDAKNAIIRGFDKEQSEVRESFSKELGIRSSGFVSEIDETEKSIADDSSALQSLLAAKAQAEAKLAVIEERRRQVKDYEDKLGVCIDKKTVATKNLALELDIEALVGKKGFLGVIVEDVLAEIAAVANLIFSRVANIAHVAIGFDTEKESSKGNIITRIVPVVYIRGQKVSFSPGLSGGMGAAVELGVDLAVADVISRRRGSYPNFLILDECLDGLGGVAKESALQMLEEYAKDRLVLVVDHDSSFQGLFHNIIEIEQIDGKSRVV